MTLFGNKQRLCIGGWMLAALVILAVNWYDYAGLVGRPLESHSSTIRSLSAKLNRLDGAAIERKLQQLSLDGYHEFFARYLKSDPEIQPAAHTLEKPSPVETVTAPALPDLTGVIQVIGQNGTVNHLCVLDGRVYKEKESIEGFLVERITAEGVLLRKSERQHFINRPEIYYSNDRGK